MSKPVVIIRTVSVEKMSSVLDACKARWGDSPLWVVSSTGRVEEMRRDIRVTRVLSHDGGVEGFQKPVIVEYKFSSVVVPVSNEGGSGYGNVFRAASALESGDYFMCSRCRKLKLLGKSGFKWRARLESYLGLFARFFGEFWAESILDRS